MSELLQVFLLSMTPLGELRLSIPMGVLVYHIDEVTVFLISVIGNLIPVAFLLLFLKKISIFLSNKSLFFKKAFNWWENNAKEKHLNKIQKYGAVGLALFVAVPLPLTGAWTGALLATIMNMSLRKSIPAIAAGVAIAGIIVSLLVIMGVNIEKYLGWQTLVGAAILIALVFIVRQILRK